jgi:hypothetical protein
MTPSTDTPTVTARVYPVKCSNPDHPKGCPFGSYWVECNEDEAIYWLGNITVGECQLWGTSGVQGETRETATQALLARLAEGIAL